MVLPKIKYPIHEFEIPTTGEKIPFRPFLVKEEKLLLMAKESGDTVDILKALKQVINNCCLLENFDINELSLLDLEYLFLKLRAISVGDIVEVSYKDKDDDEIYKFNINLNDVKVVFPENIDKNIKVNDEIGIVLKYPSASLLSDTDVLNSNKDAFYEIILKCIDKIYDAENVYECKDIPKSELEEFLDNCGLKTFEQIQKFFINLPKLYYKIEYTNKNGKNRIIELTSLMDFF